MSAFLDFKHLLFDGHPDYCVFCTPVEATAMAWSNEINVPVYEPLLFEILLKDFANLAERCVQYKSAAMELEIRAVKAFADYELFKKNSLLEKQLAQASLGIASLERQVEGFNQSADAFRAAQNDELAPGFALDMLARAAAAKENLISAKQSYEALEQKFQNDLTYQEEYHRRHTEKGNAHHFAQRAEQITRLLSQEFADAKAKTRAICDGFAIVFHEEVPPPDYGAESMVDEIIRWAREVNRRMEERAQAEVEYEVIVPLSQPWRCRPAVAMLDHEALDKAVNTDVEVKCITFNLNSVFFNQDNVRLRGINLSFGNRSRVLQNGVRTSDFTTNLALRATIYTPEINPKTGAGYHRPPIILGSVANYSEWRAPTGGTSLSCFNVSPIGEWMILLEDAAVDDNHNHRSIADELFKAKVIQDLKLHLRIIGRPQYKKASAFSPWEMSNG